MRLKDYIVVPVTDPNEIQQYYNPLEKHVFVVDNFCGVCDLDEKELEAWNECSVNLNERLKLLVSIQLPVHKAIHVNMLTNLNFFICNLQASDAMLSQTDKASIAQSYNIHFDQIKEYIEPYNCFPRLCTYFTQTKGTSVKAFFEEPFEVFETEMNKLQNMSSIGKLCALALLVMMNGRLPETLWTEELQQNMQRIFANTYHVYRLNTLTAHTTVRKELGHLIDTFIVKKEGVYLPLNEKIFNFLVLYFGNRITEHVINYACSALLKERFQFSTPSMDIENYRVRRFEANFNISTSLTEHWCWKKFGLNVVILSDKNHRHLYVRRMFADWLSGNINDVFGNPNIFHKFVFAALNNLPEEEKLQLLRTTDVKDKSTSLIYFCENSYTIDGDSGVYINWMIDNGCLVNAVNINGMSALYMSALRGDLTFVQILLEKNPDIDICTNAQESPLYAACKHGHSEVAELLIEAGAYCNNCTIKGDTPLHSACRQGLTSVVKRLLQYNADTSQVNNEGCTPYNVAKKYGNHEIIQALITHASNQ